ncbi:metalloregulator ArsR/SmtB family transcription factor [Saxibacter everestensis]|uniref:Metalloregulator ArsR/SmtB family transcription factor n=1 Tax=Saxibacter everestensis TaxID=2909229 RepID=A0ABY8QXZ1_9MICO|nr:metalloregulator ArsR/SmtB family transcription factor [Brevibacteriaceae bacterium ZFBP1038]
MTDAEIRDQTALLFKTLASASRLAILAQLRQGPSRVNDLVEALGMSQPLISQHLSVLRLARLVEGKRHGRETLYEVSDLHVTHIVDDALAHVAEKSGNSS